MKRVMVMCPHASDATSFYRGIGPLSRLQHDMPDLNLIFVSRYEWSTISLSNLVFLQRPFASDHVKIANMALAAGVPVWIDYDDDLFSIPIENRCYDLYSQESVRRDIAKLCAMATVITVSTQALADKLSKLNKNILVIPNALDDMRWAGRAKRKSPREKRVFWRGSDTHTLDIAGVASELVEASHSAAAKDWKFDFLGFNPAWMTAAMPHSQTSVAGSLDPMDYMGYLNKINPALMICPLVDNAFNRSKSNIAWIEGMFCGAALIAPNLPEFQMPGVLLYDSPAEFAQRLKDCFAGVYNLEEINEKGWEHVKKHRTLSQINPMRAELVEKLCHRSSGLKT